jgi:hypothetical protein
MAVQFDAMAELQKSFQLLFQKKNWMLAVPILVGSLVAGIVVVIGAMVAFGSMIFGGGAAAMLSGGGTEGRGAGGLMAALFSGMGILFIVLCLVAIVVAVLGYAWAYAAAEPLWKGGDPDIGGGFGKALAKLGSLAVLGIIFTVVFLLLGWTIIVPLAAGLFCIYCIPYIMQGNESGTGAIGASINLAKNNLGPTAMLFLAFIVVGIAMGIVNAILGIIPFLGSLVGLAVGALGGAFGILAVMRWYALLTGAAAPSPPVVPTVPTSST